MQNILGCCQTCQRSCDEANALIEKKVPEIQIFSHMYPVLLYNMYDYAVRICIIGILIHSWLKFEKKFRKAALFPSQARINVVRKVPNRP